MKLIIKLIILLIIISNNCFAFSIIRDDEIEDIIAKIIKPVIEKANLKDKIEIVILNDDNVNAFTAGGNIIFINSGLIKEFPDPRAVQGVIAHEMGHVIAGHVSQKKQYIKTLKKASLITSAIGLIGAIAASEHGDVMGLILAQQHYIQAKMMEYSRQHENEADRIALNLLSKSQQSNEGLIKLLETLIQRERHFENDQYILTHPLSENRISHIKNYSKDHIYKIQELDKKITALYERAVIKLKAFTNNNNEVIKQYDGDTINEIYARAISLYRSANFKKSIAYIDMLLTQEKQNPYFIELKAQNFFTQGNFTAAIDNYRQALILKPDSELIRFELAVSLIKIFDQEKNNKFLKEAINHLNRIIITHGDNTSIYHYLAMAYGKLNQIDKAKLALAEKYLFIGDNSKAKKFALNALKHIKNKDSSEYIRAEDIISITK